ncbi:MAG: hypothetical protein HYZ81_06645 [Nitrospinae bacterium]|nr:hypothetical protein [Nitrospinota bacterium]
MWDTLDRLINKPQPKQLAQIVPTLATYLEQSQGLGEKHAFSQWLDRVEGINLRGFVKTGIVTSLDVEGFIKEQFRKFALEQPEAFDLLQQQLKTDPEEISQQLAFAFLRVLAKLLEGELEQTTFEPTAKLPWRRKSAREMSYQGMEHCYRAAPSRIRGAAFAKLASEADPRKAPPQKG